MAGFFKQLASIGPALGVCTRFKLAFEAELNKPDFECYSCLEMAWEEAINPYKEREPRLYELHQKGRFGDHVSRLFGIAPDREKAADFTAKILASMCYPAFAQTPEAKVAWGEMFGFIDLCIAETEHMNLAFKLANPQGFARLELRGEKPFTLIISSELNRFFLTWALGNNVKW
jgi:hypothetical protein